MNNNKKSLALFIAIAFSAGVIFTNFIRPDVSQADTTNIIYTTLDSKISDVASNLNALQARVAALENKTNTYDSKITTLATTIKQLASIQKSSMSGSASGSSDQQMQTLTTQMASLQRAVEILKTVQKAQENMIKELNGGNGSPVKSGKK